MNFYTNYDIHIYMCVYICYRIKEQNCFTFARSWQSSQRCILPKNYMWVSNILVTKSSHLKNLISINLQSTLLHIDSIKQFICGNSKQNHLLLTRRKIGFPKKVFYMQTTSRNLTFDRIFLRKLGLFHFCAIGNFCNFFT